MEKEPLRVRKPMKKEKKFDESKLSPKQRKALEIARSQGVPFSHRFEDFFCLDLEAGNELADSMEEARKRDQSFLNKSIL